MNPRRNWKIIQIVAAQAGWKAVYCQESENRQVKISHRAILCWALVESTGADTAAQTEVRGIVQQSKELAVVEDWGTIEKNGEGEVSEKQYLLGYNDPDDHKESDYWLNQAKIRLQSENGQRA